MESYFSHFMHKTAKRQCLQDEEGKGCPFDFDSCVNNTHTTFTHKACDLPAVCSCPAQLGLETTGRSGFKHKLAGKH